MVASHSPPTHRRQYRKLPVFRQRAMVVQNLVLAGEGGTLHQSCPDMRRMLAQIVAQHLAQVANGARVWRFQFDEATRIGFAQCAEQCDANLHATCSGKGNSPWPTPYTSTRAPAGSA